jgi:hypothetical protein
MFRIKRRRRKGEAKEYDKILLRTANDTCQLTTSFPLEMAAIAAKTGWFPKNARAYTLYNRYSCHSEMP